MADAEPVRFSHSGQRWRRAASDISTSTRRNTPPLWSVPRERSARRDRHGRGRRLSRRVSGWMCPGRSTGKIRTPTRGEGTQRRGDDPAAAPVCRPVGYRPQSRYAERVPKADKGWMSCLRLVYCDELGDRENWAASKSTAGNPPKSPDKPVPDQPLLGSEVKAAGRLTPAKRHPETYPRQHPSWGGLNMPIS